MSISRLTIIGVAAVALLLLGAAVVFAQGNSGTFGPGMMRGFGAPGTTGTTRTAPDTPPGGGYGPGMMGNGNGYRGGTYGPGMMGNGYSGGYAPGMMGNGNGYSGTYGPGMMSNADWNRMRDAMNSGNWNEMYQVCRDAFNNWQNQGGNGGTSTAPATPGSGR